MKDTSMRGMLFATLMGVAAMVVLVFVLKGKVAITPANQNLVVPIGLGAAFLEIIARPFPSLGHLSTAPALYFFLLFLIGPGPAVVVAIFATVVGALFRALFGEGRSFVFRVAYVAQTTSLIGGVGLLLTGMVPSYSIASPRAMEGALWATIPFFALDLILSSIAVSQFLDPEIMKGWSQCRNRTWALTALFPLVGFVGAYLYQGMEGAVMAMAATMAMAGALHFTVPSFVEEERSREPIYDLLSEIDKFHEREKQLERKVDSYRKKLERKEEELLALMDFGRAWGTDLSLENAMRVIFDMLRKLFRYQTCIIFSSQTMGDECYFVTKKFVSPYGGVVQNLYCKFGETIVGRSAQEKKPLLLVDDRQAEGVQRLLEYERSEMAVPLVIQDKVLWVLYIGQKEDKIYTHDDLQLFTLLAYQAAIFLVYAESYEATVSLATTDGLTGLYTHRYFQERLSEEVKRAERYRLPLSLVMIDVDHFKTYNDTYGHPMGDMLLKEISQILRYYTRETDVECRYAGDEFSLILIETSKENAVMIADRIREAMMTRLNTEGKEVRVTGSFGVASIPEDAKTKAELIGRADDALYHAKKARNKVVAFQLGMTETAHSEATEHKGTPPTKPSPPTEIKLLRKEAEKK